LITFKLGDAFQFIIAHNERHMRQAKKNLNYMEKIDVLLKIDENGKGAFVVEKNDDRLAEMVIRVADDKLTVYHTEVREEIRGHGVADQLLSAMVAYARKHQLKVIPLCQYVLAKFKHAPEKYEDIWEKDWHHKKDVNA
jgi:predicted GNAT family acetyltransferase